MNKSCFKKGCTREPAFTCECKAGIYFCKKHMGDHMLIQRTHNLIPLFVILDDLEEKEVKEKADKILKMYSELLKKTQEYCKTLVESILTNSKKLVDQILNITSAATRISKSILREVPIDTEDLKLIGNVEHIDELMVEFNCSHIINSIGKEFESLLETISNGSFVDKYVFYSNSATIEFIDTKTLKLQPKTLKWDTYSYLGSTVQIKRDIYFAATTSNNVFNSQSNNYQYGYSNNCMYFLKIDLSKNTVETLHTINNNAGGGIVLYNESIFMFYGLPCTYKFEIEKKILTNLTGLPQNCYNTSACVIKDTFYVTGYPLSYIYQFDQKTNQFSNAISFNQGTFRYLLENWLVSMGDSFYEIVDGKLINHGRFDNSSQTLLNYSGFRRGNYIYFITNVNNLFRIDTTKKSIALVNYS